MLKSVGRKIFEGFKQELWRKTGEPTLAAIVNFSFEKPRYSKVET
jgi:hypothetical protein